ncbi:efflux transporter outer membrane subunit [Moraxella oblonga]|uniref:efflux transporter outer membrane subunit n=1 Tax=Moraxella oblonga TaxID=200413 RepID=UPI000A02D04D|nr:efflux transporter outer membrane subunit [Moraxella oblonga]
MKTKNTIRYFTLSALVLGMVACSAIPPRADTTIVAVPNVAINENYRIMDKDTISVEEMPSLASVRWQDFYTDPKLKALIEIGLNNNKDLQKAVLAIQGAKAQYQIKDIANIPTIGSSASASRIGSGGFSNSGAKYDVGLAMSEYEFDFWGKIADQKEMALHDYLGTNSAKDTVQITLIANIAKSYVNLSYALAQRQLALETLKTREHSLAITQERFKAGIDAKTPSLQADASLESAKLAIYKADTEILKTRNALQLLLGAPIPNGLLPDMAVNDIVTAKVFSAGLPSELLYYRPDIIKAEHALRQAGANINVVRASYFPSISLSGNLGFSSSSLTDLLKSSAFGWKIVPSISLPIFDAGARRANYEVAQIAQKQALAEYEKTIQTAFKEVDDVLATRATIGQQLDSQYRLQKNYQETYEIALARFRSGLDDYLSVLDAERSLFANQQNILQLELTKVVSQIELYQVLGGGATLEVEQITHANTQKRAMTPAKIATPEQVEKANEKAVQPTDVVMIAQPKSAQDDNLEALSDDVESATKADVKTTKTIITPPPMPFATESESVEVIEEAQEATE